MLTVLAEGPMYALPAAPEVEVPASTVMCPPSPSVAPAGPAVIVMSPPSPCEPPVPPLICTMPPVPIV
eukprot:scaffold672369_cov57-Prasinocladus_malaysianus.AAC.1